MQDGFWLSRPWLANKEFIALSIFLAAAATDILDGYLARRWKQVTTDWRRCSIRIADKLLISRRRSFPWSKSTAYLGGWRS